MEWPSRAFRLLAEAPPRVRQPETAEIESDSFMPEMSLLLLLLLGLGVSFAVARHRMGPEAAARMINAARNGWYVVVATVLMTAQPFLTTLTKNADGGYDYFSVSTNFIAEAAKFLVSLVLYLRQGAELHSHELLRPKDVFSFAAPAFIYCVGNNLIFVILMYLSSTTYQILSALKAVFTAVLFRLILRRRLTEVQYASILLVACGAATSQFPSAQAVNQLACAAEGAVPPDHTGWYIGVGTALLACVLSAAGGIYSELLLKKEGRRHSIHLQNMLLYTWGVLFNVITLWRMDGARVAERGLFHGCDGGH